MMFPPRRALRIGAAVLAGLVLVGVLYTVVVYRSVNVFTAPERIESLGRTYQRGPLVLTREELDRRYPQTHGAYYELERVGTLPPFHGVYQWQNDEIRGQATTSAYVEWGGRFVGYSLLGAP